MFNIFYIQNIIVIIPLVHILFKTYVTRKLLNFINSFKILMTNKILILIFILIIKNQLRKKLENITKIQIFLYKIIY